jgi:FtsP/CotA-like multicopper oxidase with cupredoxin domain
VAGAPAVTTRRAVLRGAGIAGLVTVAPAAVLAGYVWNTSGRSNVDSVRFGRPLAIPPLLRPEPDAAGTVRVDLALRTGTTELKPGGLTATWGVNGTYLGPTLRVRRGETLAPSVRNDLPEPTTLHWHGMELPAVADGGPHRTIGPGAVWRPQWRVDQPAATLWYHPHPHGATKEHVYRGLAGLIVVDDGLAAGLLPETYGVDDVPVIVQDKNFTDDGALDFDGIAYGGVTLTGLLGSDILVNGTWGPVHRVGTELVRLRVLNASNSRIYDFGFRDGRPAHLVGVDAGLLERPVEVEHVRVSPGERVELLVRMRPGERVMLYSRPPDLGANLVYDRLAGGDDEFDILRLDADPQLRPSPPVPAALPGSTPGGVAARERRLRLGDFTINGKTMDMHRVDDIVRTGVVERWVISNDQGVPHNFHVHNAAFAVTAVDGRPPPPEATGRKDTVYVPPGSTVDLLVSFGQYPDPHTAYMYHCHLLAHEDAGMMGQFVLVDQP